MSWTTRFRGRPMNAAHLPQATRSRQRLVAGAFVVAFSLGGSAPRRRRRHLGPLARSRGRRSARPAVDPQTPTTVYAGTSLRGVFKSTNGVAAGEP